MAPPLCHVKIDGHDPKPATTFISARYSMEPRKRSPANRQLVKGKLALKSMREIKISAARKRFQARLSIVDG